MENFDKATLAVIQRYVIESYGQPGSNMESRSYYQFTRRQIATCFKEWARDKHVDVLVDIGSSTGFLTREIKQSAKRTIAVDANAHVLAKIIDPDIEKIQDYLPELKQLKNHLANVVTCTDTLYYLTDLQLERALLRISEILTDSGYLIFNDNGNVDRLTEKLAVNFDLAATLTSPISVKSSPSFDQAYWWIESRYLLCLGVHRALNDPDFNPERDTSQIRQWALIRYCLRYRWIGHLLPLLFPIRAIARFFWSNDWLFRNFCTEEKTSRCLLVYQKR